MAEVCCCGNELGDSRVPIRRSPCRCEEPGPGKRQKQNFDASWVPDHQARGRHAQGLPAWTELERGLTAKWD